MAPSRAVGRLFVVLRAFIDDSYTRNGTFVLGGYIATVEAWAKFSEEWENMLPYATRAKNGKYHFKMSEMAAGHMDRVSAFYRIIEDNVLMSLFCKVDIVETTRAKDRMWAEYGSIDWRFINNTHGLAFRCLMDIFHVGRSRPGPINELLPPDKPVDFYFDNHSSKGAIIDAWEDYIAARSDSVRGLYGATPRFESDQDFLPLQAADFWAWWIRRSYENRSLDRILAGDFGAWRGAKAIPGIAMSCTEEDLVSSFWTILEDRSNGRNRLFDGRYWPRPLSVHITSDPKSPVQSGPHQFFRRER
jgi:hypothetical protein